jgi:hypothetical protein
MLTRVGRISKWLSRRRLFRAVLVAMALAACGSAQSGPSSGPPWNNPVTTAQASHYLAATGNWSQFETQAAMPCPMIEQMAAGQPLPWGLRPDQLCAMNRSGLRTAFALIGRQAAGPLSVSAVQPEKTEGAPPGTTLYTASGTYPTRDGRQENVTLKMVWQGGRFYVTGL